jgi:chromosome partitioning protein
MDNSTTPNKEIKEELKAALDSKFFEATIRNNVAVIKSTLKQMPVVNMSKSSNSSKDYMKLCEEVLLGVK